MIGVGEDPSDSFESESGGDSIEGWSFFVLQYFEVAIGSFLFGFVKGLNDNPNTSFIAGVFSIISIEESYSLLLVASWQPITDKILNLCDVHELNVVDMPEFLSLDDHIWRNALVAHSFGVGLMVFAGEVDFVSHLGRRQAVVALDVVGMDSFAFQLPLRQPVIERDMGGICDKLVVEAMNALGIRSMLAQHLGSSDLVLAIDSCAVEASSSRAMIAFRVSSLVLFTLFLRKRRFLVGPDAVQAFSSGRMIALRCYPCISA